MPSPPARRVALDTKTGKHDTDVQSHRFDTLQTVMAGLVPAIPMISQHALTRRDTRDKPAYDGARFVETMTAHRLLVLRTDARRRRLDPRHRIF
jgi:hypothetical protein